MGFINVTQLMQFIGLPIFVTVILHRLMINYMNSNRIDLARKVVVITGASSGLGKSLAFIFYRAGCKLVLAARRESELKQIKEELQKQKHSDIETFEPMIIKLDLSDPKSIDECVNTIQGIYSVDILINNAGISSRGDVAKTEVQVHRQLMEVNYFGTIALTKGFLPKMIERNNGHIVFVSSVQGRIAIPYRGAYAASKHACQAFADTLRAEVNKHNINVSVVSPGYIKTSLSLNALTENGAKHAVMDPTTAAGYEPEFVARKIQEMVVTRQKDLILSDISPKVAVVLRCLTPSLYFWLMAKRAK